MIELYINKLYYNIWKKETDVSEYRWVIAFITSLLIFSVAAFFISRFCFYKFWYIIESHNITTRISGKSNFKFYFCTINFCYIFQILGNLVVRGVTSIFLAESETNFWKVPIRFICNVFTGKFALHDSKISVLLF